MTRQLRNNEREKRSKARRAHALARLDIRQPSSPRTSEAIGIISHPVKVVDEATAKAIAEFLAKRGGS